MLITDLRNRNDMEKFAQKIGQNYRYLVSRFFSCEQASDFYSFDVGHGDAARMFLGSLRHRKPNLTCKEFLKSCKDHGCMSLMFLDNKGEKDLLMKLTPDELEEIRMVIADPRPGTTFWQNIASDFDYDHEKIRAIEDAQREVRPVDALLAKLKSTYHYLPVAEIASACREKNLNDAASFLEDLIQKFKNSNSKSSAGH